jgi:transposase InsO family protein
MARVEGGSGVAQVMLGEAKPFVPVNLLAKCFSQLAIAAFWNSLSLSQRSIDLRSFYNTRRPHQALGMKTPAEVFKLAA